MKTAKLSLSLASVLMVVGFFSGCDSSGGGGDVHGSVYMGVGMGGIYDPWYYGPGPGPGYYPPAVIVRPPPRPMPPRPMPRPMPRMR